MGFLLLSANSGVLGNACTFGGINTGNWVNINMIVVLLVLTAASFVYALAVLLPAATREKLRGTAKTEAAQGVISAFLVIIMVVFAATGCELGSLFAASQPSMTYVNPTSFSENYLENLLFIKSTSIFTQMYAASALYLVYGNLIESVIPQVGIPKNGFTLGPLSLQFDISTNIIQVYYAYAGILTGTYSALLTASFGVLFIFVLLLPIIQAVALTMLAPLAIAMRSLPFGGPRLRETSDAFLGIAIAFAIVFPVTITMDSYIINWMYCQGMSTQTNSPLSVAPSACNPYQIYLGTNPTSNIPVDKLFTAQSPPTSSGSISFTFLTGVIGGQGGPLSIIGNSWKNFLELPQIINGYGIEIANYVFQSIVLMALDIAITVGFAQGFSKGISAFSGALGAGPFWGNM